MRTGSRLLSCALALIFAACCWLPACGGGDDDLFGGQGQGGAPGGSGGSKAGAGGADAGAVGGSSQGGSAQGGSSQGGSAQGGSSQGGSAQGGSSQGGSSQGGSSQGGSSQGGSSQGGSSQGGSSQGGSTGQGGSGFGGASGNCPFTDSIDHDGDTWSFADGDCDDCDIQVNPGAFDGKGPVGVAAVDDDCDGIKDNAITECDTGFALDDLDPLHAAKAIGLCAETTATATGKDKRWGVISARYTKADGTDGMAPASHGLMPAFGAANAQQGANMLVLSSGTARTPTQVGYVAPSEGQMNTQSAAPAGFPKASTMCPGVAPSTEIHDPAALEVQLRVPTNAKAFGYRVNLYTYEYPDYACSQFNDLFVVLASPPPAGALNGNLSFDSMGNTLGPNCSLLQVCVPKTIDGGSSFACPLGTALLTGTGFEANGTTVAHAATGWLETLSPATPGAVVSLRFTVADVGDGIFNTTALMDRFVWAAPVATPVTQPVPSPL